MSLLHGLEEEVGPAAEADLGLLLLDDASLAGAPPPRHALGDAGGRPRSALREEEAIRSVPTRKCGAYSNGLVLGWSKK